MAENLKEKAEEQIQQRSETPEKEARIETPLDEVKRISAETKAIAEKNEETLRRLEELNANISLGGRTSAGQPMREMSQEEKDQEAADKIISMFR